MEPQSRVPDLALRKPLAWPTTMPQAEPQPQTYLSVPGHSRPIKSSCFGLSPTALRTHPRVSKPGRVQGLSDAPDQNRIEGPRTESTIPEPSKPNRVHPPRTNPRAAAPDGTERGISGRAEPCPRAPDSTPSESAARAQPPRAGQAPRPTPEPPPGTVEEGGAPHSP